MNMGSISVHRSKKMNFDLLTDDDLTMNAINQSQLPLVGIVCIRYVAHSNKSHVLEHQQCQYRAQFHLEQQKKV